MTVADETSSAPLSVWLVPADDGHWFQVKPNSEPDAVEYIRADVVQMWLDLAQRGIDPTPPVDTLSHTEVDDLSRRAKVTDATTE